MRKLWVVLVGVILGGCSIHPAVIEVLQVERGFVAKDGVLLDSLYEDRIAEVDSRIDLVYNAMYKDIEARESLDAQWTVDTIKGVRAALSVYEANKLALTTERGTIVDNVQARLELLTRAEALVVSSQSWNSETKDIVLQLLEKVNNASK